MTKPFEGTIDFDALAESRVQSFEPIRAEREVRHRPAVGRSLGLQDASTNQRESVRARTATSPRSRERDGE